MKKIIIILMLVLACSCVFATKWDSYFDISGTYMSSKISDSDETYTANSMFVEFAGYDYYQNIGLVYKFRLGKVLSRNGKSVDSELGYNQAVGFSFKYEVADSVEVSCDVLYSWIKTKSEIGIIEYTISYDEIHFAPKARYVLDNGLTVSAGCDVGFLLSSSETDQTGHKESIDAKGTRIMPFIGIGYKYQY